MNLLLSHKKMVLRLLNLYLSRKLSPTMNLQNQILIQAMKSIMCLASVMTITEDGTATIAMETGVTTTTVTTTQIMKEIFRLG